MPTIQNEPANHEDAPTILVVDDDDAVCLMLETVLQDEGYRPIRAMDGRQALNLLSLHPALIVLDLMMPVMDGWQFLELARDKLGDIPVVVLSASRDSYIAVEDKNVKAYLPKPFELDTFLTYVEQYVRKG
jgi:CheY-like chemotaxis protein